MNANLNQASPRSLGHAAFTGGKPCIPIQDEALKTVLEYRAQVAARFNQPAPDTLPAILEWRAGWESAKGWAAFNLIRA